MGDLCINTGDVKPGFKKAVKALDKNKDGKTCQSENPGISGEDFQDFVSLVGKEPVIRALPALPENPYELKEPVFRAIPANSEDLEEPVIRALPALPENPDEQEPVFRAIPANPEALEEPVIRALPADPDDLKAYPEQTASLPDIKLPIKWQPVKREAEPVIRVLPPDLDDLNVGPENNRLKEMPQPTSEIKGNKSLEEIVRRSLPWRINLVK
ncbi:hypothetical protein A2291_02090 [candidate division WOR-1 bacterium RIFOXYB2_FULL_42_35]|uniref:Uncharacterized protein n=1 Tax=candidate division WOR-1 bacterium RIFOXYC2_FULL_41_25 TaxID=1802586 RepID=A0A1F4TQ02_UNCSA|nr:MAG: hypothetical protein A2247_03890 [candidate division WOR-1 bacterium RIFOXYA2_FULL_41_14]OGC25190.1 MAG: hypothetical protein A2291_02090 [candidate division WOR-1 bacterium RIFOXYB2_FULL_42_35]OGC34746.1 MAG: hypothetical protein A2462_03405 [candidate division WOR-1 bacterium RIFOXYC2_FULL_41_25]